MGSDASGRGKQTWPTAEIPVMRPKLVMEVIFRKGIEQAEGKQLAMEQEVGEYREKCANPNIQAERGYFDKVLVSSRTRQMLVTALHFVERNRLQSAEKPWRHYPLMCSGSTVGGSGCLSLIFSRISLIFEKEERPHSLKIEADEESHARNSEFVCPQLLLSTKYPGGGSFRPYREDSARIFGLC